MIPKEFHQIANKVCQRFKEVGKTPKHTFLLKNSISVEKNFTYFFLEGFGVLASFIGLLADASRIGEIFFGIMKKILTYLEKFCTPGEKLSDNSRKPVEFLLNLIKHSVKTFGHFS